MNYAELKFADRDKYLLQIEYQIEAKRNLLLEKRKYLDKTVKKNIFLENVVNDYKKYNEYIIRQKQEQLRAMLILKQYTDDLIISTKMTEGNIKKAKTDQKHILYEMDKIKKSLDDIID